MMNPKDARLFGGVPLGAVGQQPGTERQMIQMQQPDGSMVLVPVEVATLHVLAEIRTELQKLRIIAEFQAPGEAVEAAERITQGGVQDGADEG